MCKLPKSPPCKLQTVPSLQREGRRARETSYTTSDTAPLSTAPTPPTRFRQNNVQYSRVVQNTHTEQFPQLNFTGPDTQILTDTLPTPTNINEQNNASSLITLLQLIAKQPQIINLLIALANTLSQNNP